MKGWMDEKKSKEQYRIKQALFSGVKKIQKGSVCCSGGHRVPCP